MPIQDYDTLLIPLRLMIASFGSANTLAIVSNIVLAVWLALFGYFLARTIRSTQWSGASPLRRFVLVWSWLFAAGAIAVAAGWSGHLTWRLIRNVVVLPEAPHIPLPSLYASGLLLALALLLVGWIPRALVPPRRRRRSDESAAHPAPAPAAPAEEARSAAAPEEATPAGRGPAFVTAWALVGIGVVALFGYAATKVGPEFFARFSLDGIERAAPEQVADFRTGRITDQPGDFAADFAYWRQLADAGVADAQYRLGAMYAAGRGVDRDVVVAHRWLNLAAAQGHQAAAEERDRITRQLNPHQLSRAQRLARETPTNSEPAPASGGFAVSSRARVRDVQRLLNDLGYAVGIANGVEGPRTQAGVRTFQRRAGLAETGTISDALLERLREAARSAPPAAVAERSVAAPPAQSGATANECDRLAAHPSDKIRPAGTTGVAFANLDPAPAISACENALIEAPDDPRYLFQLARSLHKAKLYGQAARMYEQAGTKGFALAQKSVGFMYANGTGVGQDAAKAIAWLRRAADRCDADAQFGLGTIYERGAGVPKRMADAVKWYRAAAARGHADALYRLSQLAQRGAAARRDATGNGLAGRQTTPAAFGHRTFTEMLRQSAAFAELRPALTDALARYDFTAVFDALRPLAEAGEPAAQFALGYMYQYGLGVPQYFARALQWYRNAADRDLALAQRALAEMYEQGQGVARDLNEALRRYRLAAAAGDAGAQHNLGRAYEQGRGVPRDDGEALAWYRKAAAQGFAPSQHKLGELYASGRGVVRDPAAAGSWFRRAAEQGLADAQVALGDSFAAGRGVPQDVGEAARWYRRAAERSHAGAQVKLAMAYRGGRGVPRDAAQAANWFAAAAAQCDGEAQYQLARLHRTGRGVGEPSVAEEIRWLTLAAEQGHGPALHRLGSRYLDGEGVAADHGKAVELLRSAAEQGVAAAQLRLAELYAAGRAVGQDDRAAARWYRKAAEAGNRQAQYMLAGFYRAGRGVPRSYVEAVEWYRAAAEQGDARARYELATAYRLGAGVEQDHDAAVAWYRRAAEQGDAAAQRDLGLRYRRGEGVLQDYIRAHLWLALAAAAGDAAAATQLADTANAMTAEDKAAAERLADEWRERRDRSG